ncbi:MAG TPA: hypothetical protein VGL02_18345 [Streptomyces sp.]
MTTDPETRYLQLHEHVDGIVTHYARSRSDAEDDRLLESLAAATEEIARLGPDVHDAGDEQQLRDEHDDACTAALLADLADARVTGRDRRRDLVPEIERRRYVAVVLDQMAGRAEQPGWLLAHRLNIVIDHALDAGLHTGLAQRLALAASRRPDGENAEDHEKADDEEHAAAAPLPHAA